PIGGSSFASGASSSGSSACSVTLVPQPEGSIETVPLACSPSQATVCSGSSLVILISPKASRCLARRSTSLSSSHSSGGDLTRVRFAVRSGITDRFARGRRSPSPRSFRCHEHGLQDRGHALLVVAL